MTNTRTEKEVQHELNLRKLARALIALARLQLEREWQERESSP